MKEKRALKIVTPERPLLTGTPEMVEMHLRIPEAVQILEKETIVEGRCRASFSGQDSIHSLVKQKLHIPLEPLLLATSKGFSILPEGSHVIPLHFNLPQNLPGTLTAKSGAIAYRITVKLKLKRFDNEETGNIETERALDILGKVPLRCDPIFHHAVSLDRHIKKRILCFNRLNAKVKLELQKAAFAVGEHILVTGEIENQHSSNVIKHAAIELRQNVAYVSGDAKKNDSRMITRLICGTVPAKEKLTLNHSLLVPKDLYPTLKSADFPIQVHYDLILSSYGLFEITVPVFIANATPIRGRRRSSRVLSDSSLDKNSIYYSSDYGSFTDPPPYSTHPRGGPSLFIPIHMLSTPCRRPFSAYSMPSLFTTKIPPPVYTDDQTRFLKIEEIE